jgi:predicted metal-dependent hydrolase
MPKRVPNYDRLYVAFLYYFNEARDYFECHEVMEELWLEEGRNRLYQGLLQVAVGLYHHHNGNICGSIKLFTAALEKIDPYPCDSLGIDLEKLKKDSQSYLDKLRQSELSPLEPYDLNIVVKDERLRFLLEELQQNPPLTHKGEEEL